MMQVKDLHLYLNVTLLQVFSKHFASKNQLPGLSITGWLVENDLIGVSFVVHLLHLIYGHASTLSKQNKTKTATKVNTL